MEQPRDPVVHHDLPQVLVVQDIREDKRTWRRWKQWEIGCQEWMEGKVLHEAQAAVSTT